MTMVAIKFQIVPDDGKKFLFQSQTKLAYYESYLILRQKASNVPHHQTFNPIDATSQQVGGLQARAWSG